jgi:hypothetical protein
MAQVIIDKGYYLIGIHNTTTGQKTDPKWVSDPENGNGIVVGIEGKEFALFSRWELKDIFKHVKKLLNEKNENIEKENDIESLKNEKFELIKLIERNQLAWNYSKDKSDGLLPEVYLSNKHVIDKHKGIL